MAPAWKVSRLEIQLLPAQHPACLWPGEEEVHVYIRLRMLGVDISRYKIILRPFKI